MTSCGHELLSWRFHLYEELHKCDDVSHCRNVDDVHNLMDDVAEQQEIANEISDAISNPVGFQQDVDEVDDRCCCTLLL